MKPLIVLISVFVLSLIINKVHHKHFELRLSARIALSAMLLFSAMGHFAFPKGMAMMLPAFVPLKLGIVYITGLFEIFLALGLLITKFQVVTAWILMAFLLLVLPANIYAACIKLNFQNATVDGDGPAYLWFRIPLQFLFIAWAYFSSIRQCP